MYLKTLCSHVSYPCPVHVAVRYWSKPQFNITFHNEHMLTVLHYANNNTIQNGNGKCVKEKTTKHISRKQPTTTKRFFNSMAKKSTFFIIMIFSTWLWSFFIKLLLLVEEWNYKFYQMCGKVSPYFRHIEMCVLCI